VVHDNRRGKHDVRAAEKGYKKMLINMHSGKEVERRINQKIDAVEAENGHTAVMGYKLALPEIVYLLFKKELGLESTDKLTLYRGYKIKRMRSVKYG
jgi:hypothetical protein